MTRSAQLSIKSAGQFLLICLYIIISSTTALVAQGGQLPPDIVKDFKYSRPGQELFGRLAFTAKIGQFQRIFSLDLKTGTLLSVISSPANNYYPSWSTDGTQLVFVSDRDGNNEIYLATWYGEKLERLTDNKADDSSPDWVPGEQSVVFSTGDSAKSQIVKLDLVTKQLQVLTNFEGRDTTPRISPNGLTVAYSTSRRWPGWDVCLYDLKVRTEQCPLGGKISHCRPFWSKDGKRLLHAHGEGASINIAIHDLAADLSEHVTTMTGREYDPIWGPDEKSILFVAEHDKTEQFEVYIKFIGEREPKKILSSPYPIRYLSWTPRTTLELEALRIRAAEGAPAQ